MYGCGLIKLTHHASSLIETVTSQIEGTRGGSADGGLRHFGTRHQKVLSIKPQSLAMNRLCTEIQTCIHNSPEAKAAAIITASLALSALELDLLGRTMRRMLDA